MALIQKAKVLEDLYDRYYRGLVDTTTLIEALKTFPGDYVLEAGDMKLMERLPPVRVGNTTADRIMELEKDKDILQRRVDSIKAEYDKLPVE